MKLKWGDTVKIDHPGITGTGIIRKFHHDNHNGVEVEIVEAQRTSDGKEAISGKTFNCSSQYLMTLSRKEYTPHAHEHDDFMSEIFDYQDREEERIPCFEG